LRVDLELCYEKKVQLLKSLRERFMLQWIVIAILAYLIYYLINKYEKRISMLNQLIELNRSEIEANKEKINSHGEKINENKKSISTNKGNITKNKKTIELNQEIIEKLKDV
jgi:peptidoglycan hydrolase CwlO-like protein